MSEHLSEVSEAQGYGATLQRTVDVPQRDAALAPEQKLTLRTLFDHDRAREIIQPVLPKGVTYEEVYAETAHAVANNPKLLQCLPMSLLRAVGRAAQTGLVIGETVHLVPFKDRKRGVWLCQKITDYKGEIELIVRSGSAKNVNAYCVYQHELEGKHGSKFELQYGTDLKIAHSPVLDPRERGAMVGAYAVADISVWSRKTIWMHITEIDAIRHEFSQQWKDGPCLPWYAKKTAVHQLAKELSKTPKVAAVFRAIESEEVDEITDGEFGDPIAVVEQAVA